MQVFLFAVWAQCCYSIYEVHCLTINLYNREMGIKMGMILRILLCIIFPPLAVLDKGCGAILAVVFLTCLGWLPGTVAALIIGVVKKD